MTTILQEEPPKASASSIADSGRSGMVEEVGGLLNKQDQAEVSVYLVCEEAE